MIARDCSKEDLVKALEAVNAKYGGNVAFRRLDPYGRGFSFTLRVLSSYGKGGRRSFSGRRIPAACWHVHGDFFDALFSICPKARIKSMGKWITMDGGNWQDRNIGSMIYPLMYSDACECG